MAMQDYKVTTITLDNDNVSIQKNIADEPTDIITYTVPKNRVVMPLDGRVLMFRITSHIAFNKDVTGSTVTLDFSSPGTNDGIDLPFSPDTLDKQMFTIWVDDDGTWKSLDHSDLQVDSKSAYYNNNQIVLDTSSLSSSTSEDIEVYSQFYSGNYKWYVEKPSGSNIRRLSLSEGGIGSFVQRNWFDMETSPPTLARTFPVLEHGRIILSMNSGTTINDWDRDDSDHPNKAAMLSLPVAIGRMDQIGGDVERQIQEIFGGG